MKFTIDSIRDHVDSASFQRGKQYFISGNVLNVTIDDEIVFGKIKGSTARPYITEFTIEETKIVDSSCSCPVGYACKHVAALGLKALLVGANNPQKYSYS